MDATAVQKQEVLECSVLRECNLSPPSSMDDTCDSEQLSWRSMQHLSGHVALIHKRGRRIQFVDANQNIEHLIIGRNEFSSRERNACWYSLREMREMKADRLKITARLELDKPCRSSSIPREEMSYRGLRWCTKDGVKELDQAISRVLTAVLDEQDRQWKLGCIDADVIATKSLDTTAVCRQRALVVALEDEQEVVLDRSRRSKKNKASNNKRFFCQEVSSQQDSPTSSKKTATRARNTWWCGNKWSRRSQLIPQSSAQSRAAS